MINKKSVTSSYRPAVLALMPAFALSAAACGSGKHPATAGSSFVSTANAICTKAVAKHDSHAFPIPNFNPLHPPRPRPARDRLISGSIRRWQRHRRPP